MDLLDEEVEEELGSDREDGKVNLILLTWLVDIDSIGRFEETAG